MKLLATLDYGVKKLLFENIVYSKEVKETLIKIVVNAGFFDNDVNLRGEDLVFTAVVLSSEIKNFSSLDEQLHEFSEVEIKKLNLKGTKVCLSHKTDVQVGEIKKSWLTQCGLLIVSGVITFESHLFCFIKYAILNGYYDHVSMQHIAQLYSSCVNKKILEISLCTLGRRPGTNILLLFLKNGENFGIYGNIEMLSQKKI